MDNLLKYLLPIYLLLYFGIAFFWRTYLAWKRTGVNPYRLGNTDTAHDFIGMLLRLTMVASALVVLLYSLVESVYAYLGPIAWLEVPPLQWIGLALLLISLFWILSAQAHMGASWRIGIDSGTRTELVQTGLFRLSRNPIFLGMRLTLLGFFLLLPNAATLTIWIVGDVLMQIQVRLEEEYLTGMHGAAYQDYCRRVRRWI